MYENIIEPRTKINDDIFQVAHDFKRRSLSLEIFKNSIFLWFKRIHKIKKNSVLPLFIGNISEKIFWCMNRFSQILFCYSVSIKNFHLLNYYTTINFIQRNINSNPVNSSYYSLKHVCWSWKYIFQNEFHKKKLYSRLRSQIITL